MSARSRHRRKDGRARAYHNVGLAVADVLPLLGALVVAERGMQDGNLVAEDLVQIGGHGGREPDLRHQQDGRAPFGQHRLHRRQVHGGLARAGDAMQQHGQELALLDGGDDRVERRLLRGREEELQLARLHSRHAKGGGFFAELDDAALHQRLQRGARDVQFANRFDRSTLVLPDCASSPRSSAGWR